MKSYCYVVLPMDVSLDDDSVRAFVKKQIYKYYIELEVEPYKRFFSEKETSEIAKRKGFKNIRRFKKYLDENGENEGIENGLYYWITTWNPQGEWDYYQVEDYRKCHELNGYPLPSSVVTLDGVWHSDIKYGYKPILDFKLGKQHPDNIEPENRWKEYLDDHFYNIYNDNNIAILYIHS